MTDNNQKLIESLSFRRAKKTKPIKAVQVSRAVELGLIGDDLVVVTLEGKVQATPEAMLCFGDIGEPWVQSREKLEQKYNRADSDMNDLVLWFPKPDNAAMAAQMTDRNLFTVDAQWGTLTGKKGDYVVRSLTDPEDIWIVNRKLFENTYQFVE